MYCKRPKTNDIFFFAFSGDHDCRLWIESVLVLSNERQWNQTEEMATRSDWRVWHWSNNESFSRPIDPNWLRSLCENAQRSLQMQFFFFCLSSAVCSLHQITELGFLVSTTWRQTQKYWICWQMQVEDFADVISAMPSVIVQVADGNSTNRNLISFRFVAFWVKCPSDSVTHKTEREISSIRSIKFDRQSFAFSFVDVAVVRTTTVVVRRIRHRFLSIVWKIFRFGDRFSVHVAAPRKNGLNRGHNVCVGEERCARIGTQTSFRLDGTFQISHDENEDDHVNERQNNEILKLIIVR